MCDEWNLNLKGIAAAVSTTVSKTIALFVSLSKPNEEYRAGDGETEMHQRLILWQAVSFSCFESRVLRYIETDETRNGGKNPAVGL